MSLHIGIIMDGNGRWATLQGMPRLFGHKAGIEAVRTVVRGCPVIGVTTVTLFAFAIANWKRDKKEVDGLWQLFLTFFKTDIQELVDEGVRVVCIGDRSGLPSDVLLEVERVEAISKENTTMLLQIALNYDGVDEVVRLVKRAIKNNVEASIVDTKYITDNLDTEAGNDPDIIIRTGMDKTHDGMSIWRSSAFLPIQSAQSVCVSSEILWPDFTPADLEKIIAYAKPEARLFGGQRK
jgi:undecaprenyl diphosphate synthase